MTKKHKAMAKRLQKLSHEMIEISSLLQDYSPSRADALEDVGLIISEWAEDILIGANSP